MSRVVVIGGSGHIGTYLVPRLVSAGFEVVSVSRGQRPPYQPHGAWKFVRTVTLSREAEESGDAFGRKIRELRPDIVIDMICFTEASARHLVDALRGQVRHFLHTGTIWVHGPSVEVPTTEMQARRPFGEYGIAKAQIEAYLIEMARKESFPATIIHPGHIVGPGWAPLNPAGHFNPNVFTMLAKSEELLLPNFGLETVHHVHADDVAQMFMCAIAHWSGSVGGFFMRFPRPQSRFAAMPRQWRHGSAASRSCAICLGPNGRTGKMNLRQHRLTITSRTAPVVASPRRSACSAIGLAIGRSRRCANR
jgi:nucleoside-diphosphate-sugar epimerase